MTRFCVMIRITSTDSVTVMPFIKPTQVPRSQTSACPVARGSCFASTSVLAESRKVPVPPLDLAWVRRGAALLSSREKGVESNNKGYTSRHSYGVCSPTICARFKDLPYQSTTDTVGQSLGPSLNRAWYSSVVPSTEKRSGILNHKALVLFPELADVVRTVTTAVCATSRLHPFLCWQGPI